jgi:hypothetical protein
MMQMGGYYGRANRLDRHRAMGGAMGHNVLNAGHALMICSRTRARPEVEQLVNAGATYVASPAEMGRSASMVITMVGNAADARQVTEGLLSTMGHGGLIIGMETIDPATVVPAWAAKGRNPTRPRVLPGEAQAEEVAQLAASLPANRWVQRTIKEGSKGPLGARFARVRVMAVREGLPGPDVWLVLRYHVGTGGLKTYLSNAPADTSLATLVRVCGMRWPIETCFEDGKQYLGLGAYEVRSWRGWHHHMTLVILAHFFLVRMRLRLKKSAGPDPAPSAGAAARGPAQAGV